MNDIKLAVFILVAIASIAGCSNGNNPTGPDPVENSKGWQQDQSYFQSDKILLNAEVSSDSSSFIVAGLKKIALYQTGAADSITNGYAYNGDLLDSKPAISDKYIAYTDNDETQFTINSPFYWVGTYNSASYPFVHYFNLGDSPRYSPWADIPVYYEQQPMGAFNDQDQFLTVINDTSESHNTNMSLSLITLNPSENTSAIEPLLEFNPEIKRIPYPTEVSASYNYIFSDGNYFYVSINGNRTELLRVSPSGEVQEAKGIDRRIYNMFSHDDTLFAFSQSAKKVYYSQDEGLNWSSFISNFPVNIAHFFYIDEKLAFYGKSQLFWVDLANQEVKELDNTGLEGAEITSVNEFNSRVWVTTLSGMYYKSTEDFFTLKEGEEVSQDKRRLKVHK